jgi:uncharacterized protein (DUF983 family)
LGRLLARALQRRCPRCGHKEVFNGYYRLVDRCPRCQHLYAREPGYWVGAIIVNLAVTEVLFGVFFVGGIFATAPEVQWLPLLVIGAVTNVLVPLLFFPLSKTVWVALDLYFNPPVEEPPGNRG